MPVRRLQPGTGEFREFCRLLGTMGREADDFRAASESSGTVVLGRFDGADLRAFAVFQPFRDPSLHLGGMIDPDYLRGLDELGDVALFNISLIHSAAGADALAGHAAELIGRFEESLLEEHEAYCLLISLFRKDNRKALGLYRSMGFRKRGGESYFMEIDPRDVIEKYGRAEKRQGTVVIRTLREATEADMESLAQCYGGVFAAKADLALREQLGHIMARPSFLADLSVAVCDEAQGGKVIGFCFIEKGEPGCVYIHAAGLSGEFRGSGVSMKCFSWIMDNCIANGCGRATLVTASKKLRKVFEKNFCARHRDTLSWHIKCGAADE
jgi:GNAT superfamily N-acetyltransferase